MSVGKKTYVLQQSVSKFLGRVHVMSLDQLEKAIFTIDLPIRVHRLCDTVSVYEKHIVLAEIESLILDILSE